jgi:hypothetical protein
MFFMQPTPKQNSGRPWSIAFALFLAGLMAPWFNSPAMAAAPDYIMNKATAADSAVSSQTPLSNAFAEEPRKAWAFTRLRKKLISMSPFWADASLSLRLRNYYFDRKVQHDPDSGAWAYGGWLEYKSGWAGDRVRIGATLYTSRPFEAPLDRDDDSLPLAPGQEAITVLGQAYLKFKLKEKTELTLYHQQLNLPFINRQDNRMVPNTFEAYTLKSSTWKTCRFIASHITRMKTRNANSFVSMSEAAGIENSNQGLTLGGVLLEPRDNLKFGFIDQYSWEHMNTFYAEAEYGLKPSQGTSVKFSGQFARQNSVGEELGGSFNTYMWGMQANLSYKGAALTLAFTSVDDGAEVLSPYGGYPGYSSLIVKKFNRAEERCWVAGVSYDFNRVGLKGVSGFVNYARGHTPDSGSNASPDQDELNLTLDYRPREGLLEGLWLRARAAFVDQWGSGAEDITEFQLILNYDFNLF